MHRPGKVAIERFRAFRAGGVELVDKLSDVGARRVAEMDATGIDMQVLPLNSPFAVLEAPYPVAFRKFPVPITGNFISSS